MPYDKSRQQRYVEITVYFKTGTKKYSMAPEKKAEFIRNLKQRNDVIDYRYQTVRNNIY